MSECVMQKKMAGMIARLAPEEGCTESILEGVRFVRSERSHERMPVLYEPSICILVQGSKQIYMGDDIYMYDPQHYFVLAVPMPFESEARVKINEPLLGLSITINQLLAAELVLMLDNDSQPSNTVPRSLFSTPFDDEMSATLVRLLEILRSPTDSKILGPSIIREIYYRVLKSEQGAAMRAALAHGGHFNKISKALRRIHAEYNIGLDVDTLAREAGMSVPAFHAHFKHITATSPIQYQKSMRLHQARLLMVRTGITAASASASVGYESVSQFSREFKRMFGRSPVEETQLRKSTLSIKPAEFLYF